jgi:mannose-6-phosphate isomerase-like protein (cupin superfamily)
VSLARGRIASRTHEELLYVLEGQFDFLVGEEAMRVREGSLVYVPPGLIHDFRNAGSTQAR